MSQYWKGSYDFTSASDENELDSSDDSDSDGAVEAPKFYHRRKSTAAVVRARVGLSFSFPSFIFLCKLNIVLFNH